MRLHPGVDVAPLGPAASPRTGPGTGEGRLLLIVANLLVPAEHYDIALVIDRLSHRDCLGEGRTGSPVSSKGESPGASHSGEVDTPTFVCHERKGGIDVEGRVRQCGAVPEMEERPSGVALQGETPNHRQLRRSRAGVVSVADKAHPRVRQV